MAEKVYSQLANLFPGGKDERTIFDFIAEKNASVGYHEINEHLKARKGPSFLPPDTEFALDVLQKKKIVEWLGDSDNEGNYRITKKGLKIYKIYKKSSSKVEKIL